MARTPARDRPHVLRLLLACSLLIFIQAEDPQDCREQEFRDKSGTCVACVQCDAGQELSKVGAESPDRSRRPVIPVDRLFSLCALLLGRAERHSEKWEVWTGSRELLAAAVVSAGKALFPRAPCLSVICLVRVNCWLLAQPSGNRRPSLSFPPRSRSPLSLTLLSSRLRLMQSEHRPGRGECPPAQCALNTLRFILSDDPSRCSRSWRRAECGFGYGEDAQCVPCRPNRFKEDRGLQKCKPCLDCALVNRFLKANCSTTSNAMCGDCLPGFYRKTKLSGFQDMECTPCGDPPPPYEPHSIECDFPVVAELAASRVRIWQDLCGAEEPGLALLREIWEAVWIETGRLLQFSSSRVNLVRISSPASSPRDTALAAVICSALAAVLLALLTLCAIYCKKQLLQKKPSWTSRAQEAPCNGAELSCFERQQGPEFSLRSCCHCHQDTAQARGPVHLIPSLCCEETCSLGCSSDSCPFHSQNTLDVGNVDSVEEHVPASPRARSCSPTGGRADAWPLRRGSAASDSLNLSRASLQDAERNEETLEAGFALGGAPPAGWRCGEPLDSPAGEGGPVPEQGV
ncbi:TNR19 factor, partial [Atractosteus spatula]|nr:TNR19 factor [Atractosteus spatula]